MKKSKFFKSSKDLLSRGFNASKCKTSLKLGSSRLKLLRNKKEAQVSQMKREIAQLLESGQDRTARIRVEHVTREEKMMAAYDLIEIYCELIVARLAIIESQKICPIDLKEAITSVVFAAPRCGDVPELLEVKKHFTDKYGKEFITAAIELRPACGVSRMLVEKLSAIAPDGPTKIKILSAIAEEHNVKWDADSFQEKESVPSNDLLNGPSTFLKESEIHIEAPRYEAPAVQVPINNNNTQVSPLSFSPVDRKTLDSDQISGVNTPSRREERPTGDERTQLFHGDGNRRRYNMEFKDATSAAQAAAESAELASMAARAAAELSTRERITRQCSSGSQGPDARVFTEQFSSNERTKSRNEQTYEMQTNRRFEEDRRGGKKEYSQSSSLKSKASNDDVDRYYRKNSMKEGSRGETSMQGNSFKYKAENAHGWPEISKNVREERIEKQPSVKSSNSVSTVSDDLNTAGVVFDKSDSDSDNHVFDTGTKYDERESRLHRPLAGQRSREHLSRNTDSWSPSPRSSKSKTVESTSSSLFHSRKNSSDSSENSRFMDGPKFDNPMPVTFDESDGPSSESEEDINISRHTGTPRDVPSKHFHSVRSQFKDESSQSAGSPSKKKGPSSSDRRKPSLSSEDEPKFEEPERKRNRGKKPSTNNQPALETKKTRMELKNTGNSSSENEEEVLNFQNLKGGFRHKGYKNPPFTKNQSDVSSSFGKKSDKATAVESPRLSTMSEHKKNLRTKNLPSESESESDSDSSEEEVHLRKERSDHKQKLNTVRTGNEVKTKPSLASPKNLTFGSDKSDSDEHLPKDSRKDSRNRINRLTSGISRRTKASSSTSNIAETPKQSDLQKNSSKLDNQKQPTTAKVDFKPTKSNLSKTSEEKNSGKTQESKTTRELSALEELSTPKLQQRPEKVSVSNENLKAATLNKTLSDKNSTPRASHVHPKLPDYDDFVQSFLKNRS